MTKAHAQNLANDWLATGNAHDLEPILPHYDDTVE